MSEYKVLVPLDGSQLAEHALAYVPALARFGDVSVTLLSACDLPPELAGAAGEEELQREQNLLSTYLQGIAEQLMPRVTGAQAVVVRGDASDVILDHAQRLAPDVLVIASHGRSGLSRWRLGSVADKILRGADCPVLVVVPEQGEQGQWAQKTVQGFGNVLLPLDGSDTSEQAVPHAAAFASSFGARLHLLRVMPHIPWGSGFVQPATKLKEDVTSAGLEYLNGVAGGIEGAGDVVLSVAIGAAAVEIENYTEANDIDLVVMTSHGRGGFSRAVIGSVTERVLGAGPPVFVIRAQRERPH